MYLQTTKSFSLVKHAVKDTMKRCKFIFFICSCISASICAQTVFYGYYLLEAQAKAGQHQTALNIIRQYWGKMVDLGDLQWVEGTYPTPYGAIKITHKKLPNGSIDTKVDAPRQVKIIK